MSRVKWNALEFQAAVQYFDPVVTRRRAEIFDFGFWIADWKNLSIRNQKSSIQNSQTPVPESRSPEFPDARSPMHLFSRTPGP